MPDLVKVIKGLEEAAKVIEEHVPERYRGYSRLSCYDAITLLREQEPVEPEHDFPDPKCPNCGTAFVSDAYYIGKPMTKYYMYCPGCGRKIKWYV